MPQSLAKVLVHIANQEEKHKKRTYQDEFREICRRHGVEIDEWYVWD